MTLRLSIILLSFFSILPVTALAQQDSTPRGSIYVVYVWRAKPGMIDAYNEYIKTIAEPIDDNARRAGAFEDVHTVTPAAGTNADWTHMRIFKVKDAAAADALGAALDAATARVVPDEAKRKANSDRSASLRDFVRREVWNELSR